MNHARLVEIDAALATLDPAQRIPLAAPVLAELVLSALPLDEDAAASAARRGLLLAAAAGDPADAAAPGGRPVLETAGELAEAGCAEPLARALDALATTAAGAGLLDLAGTARDLAASPSAALEGLAAVLLTPSA